MPFRHRAPEVRRQVVIRNRPVEADIEEEIAFHIESRVSELRLLGHAEEDARRIALGEFGDLRESRRELAAVDRHRRRRQWLTGLSTGTLQDIVHAARSLGRSPSYTLAALGTLVIGIGSAVTMFAVINGILLRPLPYRDPGRLVGTWHDMPPINLYHTQQAAQTYFAYRALSHTIDGIGLYNEGAANVSVVGQTTDPERLEVAGCTASLFSVLGTKALVGRVFSEDDDKPGAAPVAVISEGMWRAQFGGDPKTIGRRLDVNGVGREIVGVMPRSFEVPSPRTALWTPLNLDPANPPANAFTYGGIARLKTGVTAAAAQRDFAAVLPRAAELSPRFVPGITMREILEQTKPIPVLTPFVQDVTGGVARTLWLLGAAAILLWVVACVNVGNLALVRFDARRKELGVRMALGAGTIRVARSYVVELALIAFVAMVSALGVARVALALLATRAPGEIPRLGDLTIDGWCILFALGAALCAAIACTVIPLSQIAGGQLDLRAGARGATSDRREHHLRRMLIAAQVAVALVILSGSGLLFRSYQRLNAVRMGFAPEHVATLWLSLPRARYAQDDAVVRFSANLLNKVRDLPGVIDAGLTSRLPLVMRRNYDNPMYVEGASTSDSKLPPLQLFTTVGGDYFRTMGVPLLSGQLFDELLVQREGDAIVSSRTASLFWHDSTGRNAIGKRFRVLPTSHWYTVIGVVANAHDSSLATPPSPTVYFPQTVYTDPAQRQLMRTMALVVRTRGDPSAATTRVRQAVHELDPALPLFDIEAMSAVVRQSTARLRFTMILLGGAALVTLVLGAVGLYGVMAYVVSLRQRELSIRLALGATPRALAAATTGEGIVVTVVGIALGSVVFVVVARFARSVLFGVAPWDPLAICGAMVTLLGVAVLATWIPARRAAEIDPADTLKGE